MSLTIADDPAITVEASPGLSIAAAVAITLLQPGDITLEADPAITLGAESSITIGSHQPISIPDWSGGGGGGGIPSAAALRSTTFVATAPGEQTIPLPVPADLGGWSALAINGLLQSDGVTLSTATATVSADLLVTAGDTLLLIYTQG